MDEKTNTWKTVVPPPRHTGFILFSVTFVILLCFFLYLPPVAKWLSLLVTLCLIKNVNKDDGESAAAAIGGYLLVIGGLGGCVFKPLLEESYVNSCLTGSLTSLWASYVSLQIRMRMF